jgi:hypothetical protein
MEEGSRRRNCGWPPNIASFPAGIGVYPFAQFPALDGKG